jgi:hypothetical protein
VCAYRRDVQLLVYVLSFDAIELALEVAYACGGARLARCAGLLTDLAPPEADALARLLERLEASLGGTAPPPRPHRPSPPPQTRPPKPGHHR